MIYFDNSSTTAIYPQALDAYIKTSQRIFGNPSSLHELGSQANRLLQQARQQIADQLEVSAKEIFFTSGGTEGNNWVLKGTALAKKDYGRHIIISDIEHPAVAETAEQLAANGYHVSKAPVDAKGFVIVEELEQLIRKETILVSVIAVNNEVGTIQPLDKIGQILEKYPRIHFHTDAVQGIGRVEQTDWLPARVDFATFSAHKFHGPKGTGFIYWKSGRKLAPLLNGGGQEGNQRSGTENLPAIVAMAKALRLYQTQLQERPGYTKQLKAALTAALSTYEKVHLFSQEKNGASHILCFALKGIRGEVLVHALEEKQIFISTTSACSSRSKLASTTLGAMHVPDRLAKSAVRVSLDESNTMAEVEQFMIVFHQLYQKFSKLN